MQSSDGEIIALYLPDELKHAKDDKWSGIFEIVKESEQFGAVFLHQGQIAWATCRDQTKNLGYFLEKVGMIPKERQREVFDRLKGLGKNSDFGAMLEQTGLISRSQLRKCLLGHVNEAISSLSGNYGITIKQKECAISATPDLLFSLDEIMPTRVAEPEAQVSKPFSPQSGFDAMAPDNGDNILENLASLTGYQYSFICNRDAKVITFHKAESISWDIKDILASSALWIASSASRLHEIGIGNMEFVLVEHEKGSLIARCPSHGNDYFIAASFNENGKPGVIKHKISELALSVPPGAE